MPTAVTECGKGEVWGTGDELPVPLGCLNVAESIERPHVVPGTGIRLGLQNECVDVVSDAEERELADD